MKKIIAWIFVMLLLLVSSSAVAYAELTPPLPGAPTYDVSVDKAHKMLVKSQNNLFCWMSEQKRSTVLSIYPELYTYRYPI